MKVLGFILLESFSPVLRFVAAVARLVCAIAAIGFLLVAQAVHATYVPGIVFTGFTIVLTVGILGLDRLRGWLR